MIGPFLLIALTALLSAAPTQCGKLKIEEETRDAEVIFVGEVMEVEERPLMQE